MKYVMVIPDGMADEPQPSLGGQTPLEAARTPNMDWAAREGLTGWVHTVPKGLKPGSDVASLSLFGYDPGKYYTGRSPLEAVAQGIRLGVGDVAFRCNLVTVQQDVMVDYSAGHIENEDAAALIATLQERLGSARASLHAGVQYRHTLVMHGGPAHVKLTAPHDISNQPIGAYWPSGEGASALRQFMEHAREILAEHEVNRRRIAQGKLPATMIWLWGQGSAPTLPSFKEQYGKSGGIITAVDLLRGLGIFLGLEVIQVPGATGYFDTNYQGKAEYALEALKRHDLVIVHIEATDEAGHMGDLAKKIEAIEAVDQLVLGTLRQGLQTLKEYRLLIVPDHPTFVATKTHTGDAVPFAIYTSGKKPPAPGVTAYNERAVASSTLRITEGHRLMDFFLGAPDNFGCLP